MAAVVTVLAADELTAVAATKVAGRMATTMAAIVVVVATVTATAISGKDNGSNSNGQGNRQQSTKIGSKDTVAVATLMGTAATGAAMTATGAPMTAPGVGADRIAFATPPGRVVGAGCDGCVWGCACWLCVCCVPLLFY